VRRDFPRPLEAVLMRSLESDPDNRYPTAWEFGSDLIDALDPADRDAVRRYLV
jgi:hypothetical protein